MTHHLSERSTLLLLQGSLPPAEARTLARHLEEGCALCEELLAERPAADAVDGLVDEALGALAPAGARGNDVEFARIERRVREGSAAPRRRALPFVTGAIAAAVLAAGLAGLVAPRAGSDRPPWDGEKGAVSRVIPVRLRFLVVAPSPGGPPALEKGVSGEPVAAAASLQFEVESGRAAHVALVRVPAAGGAPELVWSERVGEGRSTVTLDGRPAAYPLAGLAGPQRFVLLASEERLVGDRIARAAASLAPPARVRADLPSLEGLSLDVVEVEVR